MLSWGISESNTLFLSLRDWFYHFLVKYFLFYVTQFIFIFIWISVAIQLSPIKMYLYILGYFLQVPLIFTPFILRNSILFIANYLSHLLHIFINCESHKNSLLLIISINKPIDAEINNTWPLFIALEINKQKYWAKYLEKDMYECKGGRGEVQS